MEEGGRVKENLITITVHNDPAIYAKTDACKRRTYQS